jgi:TRAP-type mannitol/chloroaromatic compound transport system substrate-binding protein
VRRRKLLSQMTLGAVSASTLASCSRRTQFWGANVQQVSQPHTEWRIATSWPETFGVFGTVQRMCDRLSEVTNTQSFAELIVVQ